MQVREACGVQFGEISLLALSQGARHFGLEPTPLRLRVRDLGQQIHTPFIAHILGQHYVVVYHVTPAYVWIADPARGRYKLRREEFAALWLDGEQGVALGFQEGQPAPAASPGERVADPGPDLWQPRHSVADKLALVPEVVALWLLLQTAGAMTDTRQEGSSLAAEGIVSALLLAVLLLLVYRRSYRTRLIAGWQAQHWATRPLPLLPGADMADRMQRLFYLPWRERRFRARLGYWPSVITLGTVLVWHTWQAPRLAVIVLLVAGAAVGWVYLNSMRFRGRYVFETEKQGRTLLGLLQKEHPLGTLPFILREDDTAPPPDFYVGSLALRPGRVWLIVAFAWLAGVLAYGYSYGVSAAGMLALLTGAGYGLWTLGQLLTALRAGQLALFDVRPPGVDDAELSDSATGTLQYRPPAGVYPFDSVSILPGRSTLILGPRRSGKTGLIQRLTGQHLDDGGVLLFNDRPLTKYQRLHLLEDTVLLGQPFQEQSWLPPEHRSADETTLRSLRMQLFPEGEARFRNPDAEALWAGPTDLLLRALERDPDILLLDESFRGMDPFRELILLENVLQIRRGRTTVISSQREELIPLVDQVIYLHAQPSPENESADT